MKIIKPTQEYKNKVIKEITEQINNAKSMNSIENLKIAKNTIPFKNIKPPEIYIQTNVLEKMFALVENCPTECQWHGLVKRSKEKPEVFYVYDVLVFPQINTAASTDTDEDKYMDWLITIMEDKDQDKFNDLRLHGHSHVNMNVYSSSIDDKFQEDILTNIKDDDYYIFFVLNKNRDICILLYDYLQNILFETKDIKLYLMDNETIIKNWAKEELEKNTIKQTYTKTYPSPYSWYDNGSYYFDPYYDEDFEINNKTKKQKNKKKKKSLNIQRRF